MECGLCVLGPGASLGSQAGAGLVTSGLTPGAEKVLGLPRVICPGQYKREVWDRILLSDSSPKSLLSPSTAPPIKSPGCSSLGFFVC